MLKGKRSQRDMLKPGQIVLITGSSSGIGAACARLFAERGLKVYGASRSAQVACENFVPVVMDVTDDDSVLAVVENILDVEGRIDIAINNAGMAYAGAVEDMSIEEVKYQFDVNVFGCFRVCKAVLPSMREQGAGVLLTIGSVGGLIGLPFQAFYSASKFALEGMMEGLSLEVRNKGISVILIEPGDIRTNITQNRVISEEALDGSAYDKGFGAYMDKIKRMETEAREPEVVARFIYSVLKKKSPRLRYRVGTFSENLGVFLRTILPSRLFERIMASTYKI